MTIGVCFTAIRDCFFNSHPHKEDDLESFRLLLSKFLFNSHPHKEDDVISCDFVFDQIFSTHILTRRMTNAMVATGSVLTFQLTSSQGG